MILFFSKKFEEQLDNIREQNILDSVSLIIQKLNDADSLKDIPNLKKLKGHKNAYRIRIGDYRIGFYNEKTGLFITTIAYRKDIYKKFP